MNTLLLSALALFVTTTDIDPADDVADVVVHGAVHHGDVAAEEIAWSSMLLVRVEGSPAHVRVRFARPLPPEVALRLSDHRHVVERDERGAAVAIVARVDSLCCGQTSPFGLLRRLELRGRQPLSGDGDVTLHAPLGEGDAVQRVSLSGATPLRFVADGALGVERRIGRSVGVDVSRDERRRLDRWLPSDAPPSAERLYLRASPTLSVIGLTGDLERAPAQRGSVALAAALAFGLLLAAGAWLYRRAAKAAELERVDALLEEEFRALG